ncbi:MAG: septum formation initiator family protein [Cytophagaceae bacterium]|jgi:cell division protein FtsB|nr:septum formation initiator family protein [Cytophagaceae bacterium]
MIRRLRVFRNFFLLSGALFIVWMVFFDSNDLISQYQMREHYKNLEAEKSYYQEKILEVKEEQQALMSNSEKLERFARENYLMRKPNEDVYVIIKE